VIDDGQRRLRCGDGRSGSGDLDGGVIGVMVTMRYGHGRLCSSYGSSGHNMFGVSHSTDWSGDDRLGSSNGNGGKRRRLGVDGGHCSGSTVGRLATGVCLASRGCSAEIAGLSGLLSASGRNLLATGNDSSSHSSGCAAASQIKLSLNALLMDTKGGLMLLQAGNLRCVASVRLSVSGRCDGSLGLGPAASAGDAGSEGVGPAIDTSERGESGDLGLDGPRRLADASPQLKLAILPSEGRSATESLSRSSTAQQGSAASRIRCERKE